MREIPKKFSRRPNTQGKTKRLRLRRRHPRRRGCRCHVARPRVPSRPRNVKFQANAPGEQWRKVGEVAEEPGCP